MYHLTLSLTAFCERQWGYLSLRMNAHDSATIYPMATERASKEDVLFPYSFLEIIDADHLTINRLAGKIRKVLASSTVDSRLSELHSLVLEVVWRLVRHDFSEDVVMRPAFASVWGDYGIQMGERDRADHAAGRNLLLNILVELELVNAEHEQRKRQERLAEVSRMVTAAFDELAEHMKVESGEVLPRFESVISADTSARLAREYADTLVMTPGLTRLPVESTGQPGSAIFDGNVAEYVHTSPAELKQIYTDLLEQTRNHEGRLWFDKKADQELEKIRIDKKPAKRTVVDSENVKRTEELTKLKVPSSTLR